MSQRNYRNRKLSSPNTEIFTGNKTALKGLFKTFLNTKS